MAAKHSGKEEIGKQRCGAYRHAVADAHFYFERFGWCERQLAAPVPTDLRLVVVIPCHDEPDLIGSLNSLQECDPIDGVEVIVVINGAEPDAQNERSRSELREWIKPWFGLHVIEANNLPRKHAGVGLARKIGLDEAVRRLAEVGREEHGVIVCYDADCRCDSNLLGEISNHFESNPNSPGCSVYFEHPLSGDLEPQIYEAITQYELHLRYYLEACRFTGHPFAYHTIGSSMAVRSGAYIRQGGMNKRKAGEDFYFLHKIIPLGEFGEVNTTRVIPSPRISDRVPFGTGRAVGEFCAGSDNVLRSYPLEAFRDLKQLFADVNSPTNKSPLREFLSEIRFEENLAEIRRQTSNDTAFQKRFFRWFDAFTLMKYVHHARDTKYGAPPVTEAAGELMGPGEPRELLLALRSRQREFSPAER
ncbi:MAG: glycosyltransferase [Limisphaerales bacterium]